MGPSGKLVPFRPRMLDSSRVIGREILGWIPYAGSYGMGGPGFVAFNLGDEWLIVAIWGAGDWMRFDDRLLADIFADKHERQRGWTCGDSAFRPSRGPAAARGRSSPQATALCSRLTTSSTAHRPGACRVRAGRDRTTGWAARALGGRWDRSGTHRRRAVRPLHAGDRPRRPGHPGERARARPDHP